MATDDRRAAYEALSLIEDALSDGFRSGRPTPGFAEQAFGLGEANPQPASPDTDTPPSTPPSDQAAGQAGARPASGPTRRSSAVPVDDSLAAIAAEAARCLACRLAAGRTRSVPGQGPERPLVMVIGEGPGAEEDRTGLPFVGPAGQLLDRMLSSIGLSRDDNCFIGNIVKCRPPMNRDPAPDEQSACMPFLDRQIALLKPEAILAAGRIPSQTLLGVKDGIGRLRGKVYDFRGIPLVATYHPSALLRDESLKRPAWEDLKLLRAALDGRGR